MICLTASRALAGARARPSAPTVALSPGASAAGWLGVAGATPSSPSTSERSRSMSAASTTPSTVSCWSVSNCLTLLTVPAPNSPSTDVSKPERLRKSWRILTSWPLMPLRSGMRSPRWRLPVAVERTSKPPEALLAAEPSVALFSAASVLASATPLGRRLAARWKRRTTLAVVAPNWPSVPVLKPARLRSVCSALTRGPWSPFFSVRLPTFLAAAVVAESALTVPVSAPATAGRYKAQAAANAASRPNADERNGDNGKYHSLWQAPTGLAVGLAPREWRYVAKSDDSPRT